MKFIFYNNTCILIDAFSWFCFRLFGDEFDVNFWTAALYFLSRARDQHDHVVCVFYLNTMNNKVGISKFCSHAKGKIANECGGIDLTSIISHKKILMTLVMKIFIGDSQFI